MRYSVALYFWCHALMSYGNIMGNKVVQCERFSRSVNSDVSGVQTRVPADWLWTECVSLSLSCSPTEQNSSVWAGCLAQPTVMCCNAVSLHSTPCLAQGYLLPATIEMGKVWIYGGWLVGERLKSELLFHKLQHNGICMWFFLFTIPILPLPRWNNVIFHTHSEHLCREWKFKSNPIE